MIKGIRRVTVIGVGLLGGSAALAIRRLSHGVRIVGVGRRLSSLRKARRLGVIDAACLDAGEAVEGSDLVILASPVRAFEGHLRAISGRLKRSAVVTDVGSTKSAVVRQAEKILGRGGPFVGSHPMAGSENKGVAHAEAGLFKGALCIITPTRSTPPAVVGKVDRLWRAMGMRTMRMSPEEHDLAAAAVSHLPHALSCLLMLGPAGKDLEIAATGFRDMTRLAGGDPEMWRDIFMTNQRAILSAIVKFGGSLARLGEMLRKGDAGGVEKLFTRAQSRRRRRSGG